MHWFCAIMLVFHKHGQFSYHISHIDEAVYYELVNLVVFHIVWRLCYCPHGQEWSRWDQFCHYLQILDSRHVHRDQIIYPHRPALVCSQAGPISDSQRHHLPRPHSCRMSWSRQEVLMLFS